MTEPEPIGSVTEEAFKLFRAMNSPGSAASATDREERVPHQCTATWCPVCQVVGFVRDNPDALAQVSQSAATLARSLRDLVDAALAPEEKS